MGWRQCPPHMRKQALTSDTGWSWGVSVCGPFCSPQALSLGVVGGQGPRLPPSHQTGWTLRMTRDAWRNHTWSLGTGKCAGPGAPSAAHRGLVQTPPSQPRPGPEPEAEALVVGGQMEHLHRGVGAQGTTTGRNVRAGMGLFSHVLGSSCSVYADGSIVSLYSALS